MVLLCPHSLALRKMHFSASTCHKWLWPIKILYSVLYVISLVPGDFLNKKHWFVGENVWALAYLKVILSRFACPVCCCFFCAPFSFLIYLHNTLTLCFFLCHNWLCVYLYVWINISHFHCCFFWHFATVLLLLFVRVCVTFVSLLLMLEVYLHDCMQLWVLPICSCFLWWDNVGFCYYSFWHCLALPVVICRLWSLLAGYYCFLLPSFNIMKMHWQ